MRNIHVVRLLSCFALGCAIAPALQALQAPNGPKDVAAVLSKLRPLQGQPSQALAIVDRTLATESSDWNLTLRNDHHKDITAWFIDVMVGRPDATSRHTSTGTDVFLADDALVGTTAEPGPIRPGHSRTFRVSRPISVDEDDSRFSRGSYGVFTLEVGLVVFDDGTFVGRNANRRVERLFESRLLEVRERVRFHRRLRRFLARYDASFIHQMSSLLQGPTSGPPLIGADYRRTNVRRQLARRFTLEVLWLEPDATNLTEASAAAMTAAAEELLRHTEASIALASNRLPAELRPNILNQ